MAETDPDAISDYQRSRCQLENVFDTGGSYRPFLTTWIKQVGRRVPLLAHAKRMLRVGWHRPKRTAPRQGAPRSKEALAGSVLGLQAGEWVRVRSANEIRATLDENGCHERTRFLQGMWKFAGKRVRVFKRIENIVDYRTGRMWQVRNTVALAGVHCEKDPSEYYDCDQTCFYYWKEAWLERCEADPATGQSPTRP